jgi:hypothetical protein
VQALSAPVAIAADALSFLGSAFFLGRIRPAEPPTDDGRGSVTAGARFIAGSGIVRASLIAVATVNFFNLMFNALYLLFAVRVLHIRPGVAGVLLGAAAVGGVVGALVTKRVAARIGAGWAYSAGCLLFTAPLVLWPLARGHLALVLVMLFVAEFGSGFGVMMLDISIGAIFAAVIPDTLRSRVAGAFQGVNYGTRPAGRCSAGCSAVRSGCVRRCGWPRWAACSAPRWCSPHPFPGSGWAPQGGRHHDHEEFYVKFRSKPFVIMVLEAVVSGGRRLGGRRRRGPGRRAPAGAAGCRAGSPP